MARYCRQCSWPRIDLALPEVLEKAKNIVQTLKDLGGYVDEQQKLLRAVHEQHGYSHGTTQHYVDALWANGFLIVKYEGARPRRKTIRFLKDPEVPQGERAVVDDPVWPDTTNPLEEGRRRSGEL